MNELALRIARLIEATGPISLSEYMHLCMADPVHGYYATREAVGAAGDFTTAPEISQMFGELIGIWCASAWIAAGRPTPFVLAEMGPGRGTLMADLLRATGRIPGFAEAVRVRLVETSAAMRLRQAERLSGSPHDISWATRIEDIEPLPLLLVANEFLDVLPIRQFVRAGAYWRELCIGLDEAGRICRVLGPATIDASILPAGHSREADGAVFEHAPAREAWASVLAERLAKLGGAALIIDYGHGASGFGDTFQALRSHAWADPFAAPGEVDLTAHVDFAAIAAAARAAGAAASPTIEQGRFLMTMGIAERAGSLGSDRGEPERAAIRAAAERLVLPQGMGSLFKVLAICDPRLHDAFSGLPPFDDVASTSDSAGSDALVSD